MPTLTKKQKEIYDYIKNYTEKNGFAPTFKEIKKSFKLKALSGVYQHVDALIRKGFLIKNHDLARGIEIKKTFKDFVKIPLKGTIAAGQPIEAIEEKETIAVPKMSLPRTGDFYALRVSGDSMIEDNIHDGDIIIIKNQDYASNGNTVVALVDGEEAALKKIYKERNCIVLKAANKNFDPIIIEKNRRFDIQGILVDVIKSGKQLSNILKFERDNKNNLFTNLDKKKKELPIDKIICGDAIENLKKLPNDSIDLVIADPPYNLSKGNNLNWDANNKISGFGGSWTKRMESWDNMPLAKYFSFTYKWLFETKRIVKPTGSIWVFGTYHNIGITNMIFQLLGIEIINEVIWYKRNSFPNLSGRRLTASHETLLWGHIGQKRKYYFDYDESKRFFDKSDNIKLKDKQMRTVWDIPNNKERRELQFGNHPTQKPLKICKRIISIASKKKNIILAPFAGIGSECLAAKEMKRHYIGLELKKDYVDIANKRLKNCEINQTLF